MNNPYKKLESLTAQDIIEISDRELKEIVETKNKLIKNGYR